VTSGATDIRVRRAPGVALTGPRRRAERHSETETPGWPNPANTSRLALALRCAVERRPWNAPSAADCGNRLGQ
jgi:hypothetical protein